MMKMKKFIALVLVLSMALAVCGVASAADEKVTVTMIAAQYGPKTGEWWADFEAKFEESHPEIDFVVDVVSWNDIYTVVNTRLSTGDAPDLLNIDTFADYQADDLLLLGRGVVQHRVKRAGDDLRLGAAIRAGQNPRAAGQQVVDLHIPHRNQPVEPCVGNLIHHSLVRRRVAALFGGLLIQLRHKALPLGDGVTLNAVGLRQTNVKELHGFVGLGQRLGNDRHGNCGCLWRHYGRLC